ncbi:hypothetical protein IQ06DRAFT_345282 [Phaeosphaeriaceae sp. SRC1lsM3a]|nr:hypothetical protein IQ06DRAFT_345282 [Stagonospora sp. SRC1lsM3a]
MLSRANAHYFFDRLLVNDTWSEPWEYIRKISPQGYDNANTKTDYDYIIPVVDPSLFDLRCGRNAWTAWSQPKTAVIHAGDTVGFAVNTTVGLPIEGAQVMPWDRYPNLYHPGPATAWLSAAPSSLDDYEGDGQWFKILSVWTFAIPKSTPPGDYLLRFEHVYPLPANSLQGAQFYANCAHITIINQNVEIGTPGPMVKIPGVYTFGQKELYFFADVGNETYNIHDFVEPKPKVWS